MKIEWNKVTWYSWTLAGVVFLLIVPLLAFYFVGQYQEILAIRSQLVSNPKSNNKFSQSIKTKSICEKVGGRWTMMGFAGTEGCDLPHLDGGKVCRDSSECDGSCIATLNSREEDLVKNGKTVKKNGVCTSWTSDHFGCNAGVSNGIVKGILCVD